MSSRPYLRWRAWMLLAVLLVCPRPVQAFCGFFAGKSDATLVSEASSLVVMREGQRTVLTLQPYYRGPIADFSIILPVPTLLRKHQVKTLDAQLLEQVDTLAAPRLVEYWEQDPCSDTARFESTLGVARATVVREFVSSVHIGPEPAVRVEAKFSVGEYEIVILGARDSLALESWLRANDYQLPAGASEALRPYVETGSRFFVARVNAHKVKFDGERALLSPLRFYYDSPELSVPVRLGLLNAAGEQDLVVTVIARDGRYEAANRPNVAVPTNLDLRPEARARFDEFYAALLDHSFAAAPEAVLTEYAWQAGSCDPCPASDSPLRLEDLMSLGLDVIPLPREIVDTTPAMHTGLTESMLQRGFDGLEARQQWPDPSEFVITRLHMRIAPDDRHTNDIVLRRAGPIVGGREYVEGSNAEPSYGQSNFQARYAIRHTWEGPIRCDNPIRGNWNGRPPAPCASASPPPSAPPAYMRSTAPLSTFVEAGQLPAEQNFGGEVEAGALHEVPPLRDHRLGHCAFVSHDAGLGWAWLGFLGFWAWRQRSRA